MRFTYENEDGEEISVDLPTTMEVCSECEGHGFVLCDGMRRAAYTTEEFEETFDDEERAEYFKRGGRYDVSCPDCGGKNVVPVVDVDHLTDEQRVHWTELERQAEQRARWDAEDRATYRMESGGY
jgi:RecJ-like exonuclease